MGIPSFGSNIQKSELAFYLQDFLAGMGDYLTQNVGSLNWIECMVDARAKKTLKEFIVMMANQLSPNTASVLLSRWATMYNTVGLSDPHAIGLFIDQKQAQFGTPPNLTNLDTFMTNQMGSIFIDLEWTPELQSLATTDPVTQIVNGGNQYVSPLSNVMVYVWQPRDNQDNILTPNSIFSSTVESYRQVVQAWSPGYNQFITMNLTNSGNQDGYANGYNGLNYNNYLDGYNVVSGTAGTTTITGTSTTFLINLDGSQGDFIGAVNKGYYPPIQMVDDSGTLQTYYVSAVASNTSLTVTVPLVHNITNRTYRTLGFILDQDGMLDSGGLLSI